jgi:hypothetical protein
MKDIKKEYKLHSRPKKDKKGFIYKDKEEKRCIKNQLNLYKWTFLLVILSIIAGIVSSLAIIVNIIIKSKVGSFSTI